MYYLLAPYGSNSRTFIFLLSQLSKRILLSQVLRSLHSHYNLHKMANHAFRPSALLTVDVTQ